jgi:hypothetical protein
MFEYHSHLGFSLRKLREVLYCGTWCRIVWYKLADDPWECSVSVFRFKDLRIITDAPWYVSNTIIRKDLQISMVKHEISRYSYHYSKRFSVHPNELILNQQEPPETRRLRKNLPIDLLISSSTSFNQFTECTCTDYK